MSSQAPDHTKPAVGDRAAGAITIHRPNIRHELGLLKTWAVMAGNIWGARELIWQLFKRDFVAGYKKSFIGYGWVFLSPLMGILSWVFLQHTGMLVPGDVGIPYPAYVMLGSNMWGLFMGLFLAAAATLSAGSGLLMQVNYPHEALLFKQVANALPNFVISFTANVVLLFAFGVVPSWGIVLLPLVAVPLFFLAAALGLMVSMVSVVAYDVSRVVDVVMNLLMYSTPIIYSPTIGSPLVQAINRWNPLTYLVCSCRDIVIYGRLYHPPGYWIAAGLSFLAFLIAWRLFFVSEDRLVERMV